MNYRYPWQLTIEKLKIIDDWNNPPSKDSTQSNNTEKIANEASKYFQHLDTKINQGYSKITLKAQEKYSVFNTLTQKSIKYISRLLQTIQHSTTVTIRTIRLDVVVVIAMEMESVVAIIVVVVVLAPFSPDTIAAGQQWWWCKPPSHTRHQSGRVVVVVVLDSVGGA